MAITPKALYGPDQLSATQTQLYSCPVGTRAQVTTGSFTNTDTAVQSYSIWLVRSGDTASDANLIVDGEGLSAKQNAVPRQLSLRNLSAGDAIYGQASSGAKITAVIDGFEMPA